MSARDHPDNRGVFIELWVLDLVNQDFPAAMLLSQILWWVQPAVDGSTRAKYERDGFMWLVRPDNDPAWWDECRLTKKQVVQAKTRLRQAGFIETIRVHSRGRWVSAVRAVHDVVRDAAATGSEYSRGHSDGGHSSRSGVVTEGTLPDREQPITPDRERSLCSTGEGLTSQPPKPPQPSEPSPDTADTRSARGGEDDNEGQPPPASSSSSPSQSARAKNETETTNNSSPSTSNTSAPEGAQQAKDGCLSNDQDEPGDLFGGSAKPAPKRRSASAARVDSLFARFMELYPMDKFTDVTDKEIKDALKAALVIASSNQIIEGLQPWVDCWATGDNHQYVKNPASWLWKHQWTKPPAPWRMAKATPAARGPVAITVAEDPDLHEPQSGPRTAEEQARIDELWRDLRPGRGRTTPTHENKENAAS